jgi:hypothetical protein
MMKKYMFLLALFFLKSALCGQVTFNRVHPVSWQEPPYNYNADGYLTSVFEIDRSNDSYDGYLCFGYGILCNPGLCAGYTKIFSGKTNIEGELIWSNSFEIDSTETNSTIGVNQPNNMTINHNNQYTGVITNFLSNDPTFASNKDYIINFNWTGIESTRILIDSTFDRHIPYGIAEDFADSTYLIFGGYMDSISVVQNIQPDGYLMKTDTLGNILWQQNYDETFSIYEVLPDTNGYWLIGEEWLGDCGGPAEINFNCIVIHTDLNGIEQDRIEIDGNCGWETARILPYDDHYVLAGMITYQEYDDECDKK